MSEPGDCRRCRDYRGCVGKPWFNFAEIRFCIWQIIWILRNAWILRAGHWPQDPDNSSDNLGQRSIKTEATFTKPILILAEVETRLKRTGIYGKLLVAQIEADRGLETLDPEAREALMYVKGWRRKDMPFNAWKWQQRHRKMNRKN